MKTCSKCKTEKPVTEFFNSRESPDGLSYWCKACNAERQRATRDRRRESGLPSHSTVAARRLRLEVLSHYSDGTMACDCCGDDHVEFLSLDHIDGGGNQHRKELGSNQEVYRQLRQVGYPPGYRVLCHNCNSAIGFYGYCPHEHERDAEMSCCIVGPFTEEDEDEEFG